jgi:hypothetical protein
MWHIINFIMWYHYRLEVGAFAPLGGAKTNEVHEVDNEDT